MSYEPFDVEDYQDAASDNDDDIPVQFPPPTETNNDVKNWPKSCPFLHMNFDEFAISDKRKFMKMSYHFWHFLTFTLLFNLCSNIVTSLISPTPKEDTVYFAFIFAFLGFWWFFFGHFRLIYHAMRYRKSGLYFVYQLETAVLFFLAVYMIFSSMGNMTQVRQTLFRKIEFWFVMEGCFGPGGWLCRSRNWSAIVKCSRTGGRARMKNVSIWNSSRLWCRYLNIRMCFERYQTVWINHFALTGVRLSLKEMNTALSAPNITRIS